MEADFQILIGKVQGNQMENDALLRDIENGREDFIPLENLIKKFEDILDYKLHDAEVQSLRTILDSSNRGIVNKDELTYLLKFEQANRKRGSIDDSGSIMSVGKEANVPTASQLPGTRGSVINGRGWFEFITIPTVVEGRTFQVKEIVKRYRFRQREACLKDMTIRSRKGVLSRR